MIKKIISSVTLILIVLLVGSGLHIYSEAKTDSWKIYSLALESAMEMDTALNHDIKYIAIDLQALDLSPKDEALILTYFEHTYDIEVFKATYSELRDMGYVGDHGILEGLLLTIEDSRTIFMCLVVEGSKHRSGTGAIGFKSVVYYAGINKWKLLNRTMTWIS